MFGGGARTLGLLYAAPGALVGALTTGWVRRVRRQGRTVIVAVIVWGAAITGFGLTHRLPAALALLAVAGFADVISAVFRSTIIQVSPPHSGLCEEPGEMLEHLMDVLVRRPTRDG